MSGLCFLMMLIVICMRIWYNIFRECLNLSSTLPAQNKLFKIPNIHPKYKISHQNDEICHLKMRPSKTATACLVLPGLCCPKYPKPLQIPDMKYKISNFQGLPHRGRTLLLGPILSSPASSGSSFFPHGEDDFFCNLF